MTLRFFIFLYDEGSFILMKQNSNFCIAEITPSIELKFGEKRKQKRPFVQHDFGQKWFMY